MIVLKKLYQGGSIHIFHSSYRKMITIKIIIILATKLDYSGTSNEGHSGQERAISLLRTLPVSPKAYMQYIFNFRKEDSFPTRDKMVGPKASFTQRFHCNYSGSYQLFSSFIILEKLTKLNW